MLSSSQGQKISKTSLNLQLKHLLTSSLVTIQLKQLFRMYVTLSHY